jgi:hypothetical protein
MLTIKRRSETIAKCHNLLSTRAKIRLLPAGHMLAEIYRWFTEGFETTDLKEATALPDQLGA